MTYSTETDLVSSFAMIMSAYISNNLDPDRLGCGLTHINLDQELVLSTQFQIDSDPDPLSSPRLNLHSNASDLLAAAT